MARLVPEAEVVDNILCETWDCTGCTIVAENRSAFQPKEPVILCVFEGNGCIFSYMVRQVSMINTVC